MAVVTPHVRLGLLREEQFSEIERDLSVYERVDHPNVVPFKGRIMGPNNRLCFAVEWCEKGSLRDCLDLALDKKDAQNMPNDTIKGVDSATRWKWGRGVAMGLAALHRLDPPCVHRNLTASNVLIASDGRAMLTDMGFSSVAKSISNSTMMRSCQWFAPEAMRKPKPCEAEPDPRKLDIWSLGCVLLEIFTNKKPFTDYSYPEIFTSLLIDKEGPPELQELKEFAPPALYNIVKSCLQIDPAVRPDALTVVASISRIEPSRLIAVTAALATMKMPKRSTLVLSEPPQEPCPPNRKPLLDADMCVICQDTISCMVMTPCGHLCVCFNHRDARAMSSKCPVCMTRVTGVFRVFRS